MSIFWHAYLHASVIGKAAAAATVVLAYMYLEHLASLACEWVTDRFEFDLNPLFILSENRTFAWDLLGIPRRFKVRRRWDRPGALVDMGDGRRGKILYVLTDDDVEDPVAAVQPAGSSGGWQQPEWVPMARVTPATPSAASPGEVTA